MKLEGIPVNVNYDDAALTCWNGEAFVTWEKWRLSVPVRIEAAISQPESITEIDRPEKTFPADQEKLFSSETPDDYFD